MGFSTKVYRLPEIPTWPNGNLKRRWCWRMDSFWIFLIGSVFCLLVILIGGWWTVDSWNHAPPEIYKPLVNGIIFTISIGAGCFFHQQCSLSSVRSLGFCLSLCPSLLCDNHDDPNSQRWGNDDDSRHNRKPIFWESVATQELVLAEAWIKLW